MKDLYVPTSAERQNALQKGDFLKISGDGIFATLQGEGVTAGLPAVFLRLQNCNLHCGANGNGWPCDAWYTWDRTMPEYWQELTNMPVHEAQDEIKATWGNKFTDDDSPRLVITGGEPLLQQAQLVDLISGLDGWEVEIETNGTIAPIEDLRQCQFNCSPKLSNSGNIKRSRLRPQALNRIASMPNSWFKFVIMGDDDIEEVREVVDATDISYDRVLLMSEGTAPDQLAQSDVRLRSLAKELGCIITARNQIFWFGNKRAT